MLDADGFPTFKAPKDATAGANYNEALGISDWDYFQRIKLDLDGNRVTLSGWLPAATLEPVDG